MSTYLLIDLGYFLHFRYYATLAWFKRAFPEVSNDEVNIQQDERFQNTLLKRVNETIHKLIKQHNIKSVDVLFCKDCSQANIWRNSMTTHYKSNRISKDVKTAFSLIYQAIINMTQQGLGHLFQHPEAEADDIVYCLKTYFQKKSPHAKFIIVANDNDYYQLCDSSTQLIRLDSRSAMNKSLGDPKKDLLYKIILGDKSDNILGVFPKCGPKTALKYVNNSELFEKRLKESPEYQKKFIHNQNMIDMSRLPDRIKEEIIMSIETTLNRESQLIHGQT